MGISNIRKLHESQKMGLKSLGTSMDAVKILSYLFLVSANILAYANQYDGLLHFYVSIKTSTFQPLCTKYIHSS